MVVVFFRILFLAGIVAVVYLIARRLLASPDFIRCSRCEGKGFWYDARGKETCDWCKGSGRLPNPKK